MSNIKQYKLSAPFADFEVVVEIDHDKVTDELLTEINTFWSGDEERLDKADGNVLHAVLGMLYRRVWWALAEMGGYAHIETMVDHFKRHMEGWPLMDGSAGIRFISFDEIEFDHSVDIEEVVPC